MCGASQCAVAGPLVSTSATMARSAAHPLRSPPLNLTSSWGTMPRKHDPTVFAEPRGLVHFGSLAGGGVPWSEGLKVSGAFPMKWQHNPANLSPEVISLARNFHHNGLPILRLWGSGRNLLAVGVNPHGVPGVYFTQRMD